MSAIGILVYRCNVTNGFGESMLGQTLFQGTVWT